VLVGFIKPLLLLATLSYPFTLYWAMSNGYLQLVAGLMSLLLLCKLFTNFVQGEREINHWLPLVLGLSVMVFSLLSEQALGMLIYPVVINGALFVTFYSSLISGVPVITRLAQLREPLDQAGLVYTRKLTKIWSLFFLVNGSVAAITIGISHEAWMLYNGFISYLLIGALGGGEWIYRKRKLG
jgi:uncharacterized membrane protein